MVRHYLMSQNPQKEKTIEEQVDERVYITRLDKLLDFTVNWGRKNSLWPMPMGISCCAIEMMAFVGPKFDVARFGSEALRFSPRQADVMIVAGTLTYKMAPVVRRIYDQMMEPKWVIAMGACLLTGGMFDSYSVVQGLDKIIPVDVYLPGCPPRPEAIIEAIRDIQKKIEKMHPTQGYKRDFYPIKVPIPKIETEIKRKKTNTMILNMGPQHPSTHGVLRVILELDGERVVGATPDIGYLHRGYEKIAENRTYYQFIPYTDRLDYLSSPANNISYCMAVEKLLGIEVPKRGVYLRTIVYELARIASHLVAVGTYSLDVGAATVFFYTWAEREWIYNIYEMMCGARLTTSFARVGGVMRDATPDFLKETRKFIKKMKKKISEWENLLSSNRIWLERTKNVGVISKELAMKYALTGPTLRASGINWDLRKNMPYLAYPELDFNVVLGENGDCYDRYLVRILEMRESIKIIEQALEHLPEGPVRVTDRPDVVIPTKQDVYTKMESLIYHFKIMSQGFNVPAGEAYVATENSKGELGWYIQSDGGPKPKRLRIHSPAFMNIQVLPEIVEGRLLADVITTIASLDPVMGEIDR